MLQASQCCHRGGKRRKDGEELDELVSMEFSSVSVVSQEQKDSVVRIILAGKMVEMYTGAIAASVVMEKYPGLCLARPSVFKNPHSSVVKPTEKLLPGQKFYMIPRTTMNKLRRKQPMMNDEKEVVDKEEDEGEDDDDDDNDGGGACSSANEFYVSRERWKLKRGREQEMKKEKKPFKPPFKGRTQEGILGGWKPSLPTVKEISP
ncbi:hypothetical protein J5N97_022181 [Dioscorea zingiberensis]|uniref:Uncharacterized protein n=1 Tax=Dioscorea zingiberensis TaxID=325984 RepID=A0A9D5HAD8_9LILI|nr:hypothetical protein J5N97_022181 [Dioscorea zingiberensis]